MTPCISVSGNINLISLRVNLIRHWRYKKNCPNANWCYILNQVDIKLIDKDLREWVTGIKQGIVDIKNLPYRLAIRLAKRAVIGVRSSRRVRQSALGESSTVNTPGVVTYFHVGSIGLILS